MIYTYDAPEAQTQDTVPRPPLSNGKQYGVVYTKPWVVDLILDLAGYVATNDLGGLLAIEPAAGDGSFLRSMVERLVESCARHGRSLAACATSLLAFELDEARATQAQQLVANILMTRAVPKATAWMLARGWVQTGDYLQQTMVPAADVIVGNPPYVRLEHMDPVTAAVYRRRYRTMVGRADLYVAFYEAALRGLKPGGTCAFVCADRWMLNQYGAELRRLVTASFAVEAVLEMHRADAFVTEVNAYPAITVLRRGVQGSAIVANAGPGIERAAGSLIHQALLATPADGKVTHPLPGLSAARVASWFSGTAPWPCSSPERLALLKHLEAEFFPLESVGTGTKVGIGVATGADEVFITTNSGLVESNRLLPLAMAADTRGGTLNWSGHYLVNPWNERGLVDVARYPRLGGYLEIHEAKLRRRHVGKRHVDGWFRTIDRVDARLTGRPKLYIPDIKDRLNPVLDRGQTYPHHNLYWITTAGWDIEVLGGLLLSDVAQFFVECYGVRVRGGYLRFQAQYLRRIRVPRPHDLTPAQTEELRGAFRSGSRERATAIAMTIYGIDRLPSGEQNG